MKYLCSVVGVRSSLFFYLFKMYLFPVFLRIAKKYVKLETGKQIDSILKKTQKIDIKQIKRINRKVLEHEILVINL